MPPSVESGLFQSDTVYSDRSNSFLPSLSCLQPFLPSATSEHNLSLRVLQILQSFLQVVGGVHSVLKVPQQDPVPQQSALLLQPQVVSLQAVACLLRPGQEVPLPGHRGLHLGQLLSLGLDIRLAPEQLLLYI